MMPNDFPELLPCLTQRNSLRGRHLSWIQILRSTLRPGINRLHISRLRERQVCYIKKYLVWNTNSK